MEPELIFRLVNAPGCFSASRTVSYTSCAFRLTAMFRSFLLLPELALMLQNLQAPPASFCQKKQWLLGSMSIRWGRADATCHMGVPSEVVSL
ncbi:hypothetical protein D3C75_1008770 [compost metagenome]